ncbi:hypothetical protein U9M48_040905 [Paspalum notatum var. saurae]|uniref:Reverse transcriptase domain-containing protein n=1 Tax=Paspalum notatum var. saurae TaxID=547442 RepID=A0AAQ3UN35_PASNO
MKGFSPKWIKWVKTFVSGRSVAVNANEEVEHFFQTKKGLRQGDPLSPLPFNIVADMLATLIKRAKLDGRLEYADDTVIFLDHDLEMAHNMKPLLCAFEQLSGLKINFNKGELYCFGDAQDVLDQYMEIFGCKNGEFPFSYLGIPIHFKKLRNADWKKVEERFEKRLSSWKGKHLSIGGRLTLINSVLSSLPMYMMSFFDVPKGVIRKLDYFRSRFFWQGDEHKKKYRLAKRSILSQPKDQGGLGIHELGSTSLSQVEWRPGDSHFWSGLLKAKQDFLFWVKDGSQVRFWKDIWLGSTPLQAQYPCLYNIARPKNITIAEVLSSSPPNLSWRRDLNGVFSVKSHYQALIWVEVPNLNKMIWKIRAPLKVKIFLWYLRKGVLLTKDNLTKCNWQGSKSCAFCHNDETIEHLFFECRFARTVWAFFQCASNLTKPNNAPHVIFAAVHWVRLWAILQTADSQDMAMEASRLLFGEIEVKKNERKYDAFAYLAMM